VLRICVFKVELGESVRKASDAVVLKQVDGEDVIHQILGARPDSGDRAECHFDVVLFRHVLRLSMLLFSWLFMLLIFLVDLRNVDVLPGLARQPQVGRLIHNHCRRSEEVDRLILQAKCLEPKQRQIAEDTGEASS
jgi:hypothetical protein